MSKWYAINDEGDMYCLGECKDLQEAHKVADETGIDNIVSLIDGERAESWAKFILRTLNEDEDEDDEE